MSSITKDITKTFGENIILTGNSIIDTKNVIIPVSPVLDILLNGGIPEGSFVVLTGQPKCGKTTTSLDFAATAQDKKYAYGPFKDGREAVSYTHLTLPTTSRV